MSSPLLLKPEETRPEARGDLRADRRRAGRGRADLRGRAGQPIPVRAAARRPLRRLPRQAAPAGPRAADAARPAARSTPAHPVLAAVVEMIHTATLVHDDILDEAVIRRHAATVNAEWGNETGRPAGRLPVHPRLPPRRLARIDPRLPLDRPGDEPGLRGRDAAGAQPRQPRPRRGRVLRDHPGQDRRADRGLLPARGRTTPARRRPTVEALEDYGRDLGVAFQIADDVLDIWGEERTTGKSLGTDLEKQKLTLPLIRLLGRRPRRNRRSRPGPAGRGPAREPPRSCGPTWNDRARSTTPGTAPASAPPRPSPSSTCSRSRTPSRSSARSATTSSGARA